MRAPSSQVYQKKKKRNKNKRKKCSYAVITVYSKSGSRIEEIQTGFIFSLLYPVSLEQGGLQRPESTLIHLLGPEKGFTPTRHTLLLGRATSWGVALWLHKEWRIDSPPHPACLAHPAPQLVLPLLPPILKLLHAPFSESFLLPVLAGLMGLCFITIWLEHAQVHDFGLSWVWLFAWHFYLSTTFRPPCWRLDVKERVTGVFAPHKMECLWVISCGPVPDHVYFKA